MTIYQVIIMENEEGRFGCFDYLNGYEKAQYFTDKKKAKRLMAKYQDAYSKAIMNEIEVK